MTENIELLPAREALLLNFKRQWINVQGLSVQRNAALVAAGQGQFGQSGVQQAVFGIQFGR